MAKIQNSVGLSPEVWAQVDDAIPYFGESRGEVITHALNVWFGGHRKEIEEQRAKIDALKPRIEELVRQNKERLARQKTKKDNDASE